MTARDREPGARRPGAARPEASRPRPRETPAPEAPPPLTWRDPWAWASALAILPLLARAIGAPLGEAVAEDFDFLRRTMFHGMGSLLDGGGSTAFWRPVAHQLYYATLGPVIVSQPRLVAALHALLLAAGALLVFRALRPRMSGVAAFVAATFPMFSESTRTLVAWPSQFVDVGVYFFSALALHEAARKRLGTALASSLLALLCKEVAIVTVLTLPWLPGVLTRPERRRWLLACVALLAAWALAYLGVRSSAHLTLPHGVETGATSWPARLEWAFTGSLRGLASLALLPSGADLGGVILLACMLGALLVGALAIPAARARLAARRAWIGWGLGWFLLATATLAPIHPLWQPNRTHFGATGAGVAAGVALEAVSPWAAGALVAGRVALLMLAPPAAATIAEEPPETGAFMDFAQLSRLQRFMATTRTALARRFPDAAPHSNLVTMNLPRGLIYALGGDRAAQVWYRDTTLRTVTFTRLAADSTLPMLAGVQFQLHAPAQVVLLAPDAMRAQDLGFRQLQAHQWAAAVTSLDRADALEPDEAHQVFHGNNAGYRSLAYLQLRRVTEAERDARRAIALDERDKNGGRVLVSSLLIQGRLEEAATALAQVEGIYPNEPWVASLRSDLETMRRERAGGNRATPR